MDIKKTFIVLADISGYTKFVKLHKLSVIHAEQIINELIESIIRTSQHPLILNKLEGDAVLFYAVSHGNPQMAQDILQQIDRFFDAFRTRERELVSECGLCACRACKQADQLRLKAILHYGDVLFKQIGRLEEIAGEEVIRAHRLLKNSIHSSEYILLSNAFYQLSGKMDDKSPEHRIEDCEGLGELKVVVYYPLAKENGGRAINLWDKVKMLVKIERYSVKRLFWKPSMRYFNLEQAQA